MKYKINWSKDAGEEFIEIISWYKNNAGKSVAQKILDLFDNPVGCLTSLAVFQAKALQNCDF
ncbi:MAG: hypothetical protein LBK61_07075 [Spirochaetaceae bacterium]|jgi:hypothetical protein|nr:hypothetical protein [Spirochaetaceae bacterium]